MPARSATAPVARGGLAMLAVVGLSACAAHGPAPCARSRWSWLERRADYVRASVVWLGGDLGTWVRHMRSLDLRAGPPGPGAFAPGALVRCTFVAPPDAQTFSGATPKFLCRQGAHDSPFKVKWGDANGEIHADLAATRLLWALGFATDRIYPVRVECRGCADDPWRDPTPHPDHRPVTFAPAIAERQLAGETIEERPHQGWTWSELDHVDPAAGGAPRAHVDALRLLAAFIQHRDSKADNQRLACPPNALASLPDGSRDCRRPVMLIDDLGSAFGGPSWTATYKMRLGAWTNEPVWKDAARCIANVTSERDATDGLDFPRIGEDGRRFLATLLGALDRRQVTALFRVARVGGRGGVAAWVAAFERRRNEVLHPVPADPAFRCPASPATIAEDAAS